jgi:hypothetical protein
MPRGRPKKVQPLETQTQTLGSVDVVPTFVETVQPTPVKEERILTPEELRIKESRTALDQPLPPGTRFFETPDGEIIVGDAEKSHVWSRRMNGGRGGWVNPRR